MPMYIAYKTEATTPTGVITYTIYQTSNRSNPAPYIFTYINGFFVFTQFNIFDIVTVCD